MRPFAAIVLCVVVVPLARAEHTCDDGMPDGHEIKRDTPFPGEWLRVGHESIVGSTLHEALKAKYPKQYVSGWEEGPFGDFCAHDAAGYLQVSTSDFGASAWYSLRMPKCAKCGELPGFVKRHPSGTGLRLGQSKRRVAEILGVPIEADATSLTFDEHVVESGVRVLHSHNLTLEFKKGHLVRFAIGDYRESD